MVNEYVLPQSTAKWCKWHRDSYAVGSLARFNLNADQLLPMAVETAKQFGLKKGACNPYLNNVAQVVECAQVDEHSLQLLDELCQQNEVSSAKVLKLLETVYDFEFKERRTGVYDALRDRKSVV